MENKFKTESNIKKINRKLVIHFQLTLNAI